jgi:hypothetical protein
MQGQAVVPKGANLGNEDCMKPAPTVKVSPCFLFVYKIDNLRAPCSIGKDGCNPMRKSKDVPLTLLAALALFTTTGCKDTPEPRNCVDSVGRLAPEANCQAENNNGSSYHHVYGGSSGGHIGDIVVGSSSTSSSGEEGVSRGGFGHGGGGEGGGE